MGLFYAYAKHVNDDWSYRYIITFASRGVADEWWRIVSEKTSRFQNIKRVSPQFYLHDPNTAPIQQTITDPACAPQFLGKIFFTLILDRDGRTASIIPPQCYTDHLSGEWFYIRSKSTPHQYWHIENSRVYVSKDERTPFRISRLNGAAGTVMIASDVITISTQRADLQETAVGINTAGLFYIEGLESGEVLPMKFGDFLKRIFVLRADGTVRLLPEGRGGTAWELTD